MAPGGQCFRCPLVFSANFAVRKQRKNVFRMRVGPTSHISCVWHKLHSSHFYLQLCRLQPKSGGGRFWKTLLRFGPIFHAPGGEVQNRPKFACCQSRTWTPEPPKSRQWTPGPRAKKAPRSENGPQDPNKHTSSNLAAKPRRIVAPKWRCGGFPRNVPNPPEHPAMQGCN